MKIDDKTVEWLAFLAHLQISEDRIDAQKLRLENMAEVIRAIRDVETEGIAPMTNPFDATLTLRADVVTVKNERDELQKLAQSVEDGLYLVPQVIE
ncbi:Asp-tRNA(Asn)/Glu-tRNA(Gln) amidotransferase subunit GatC [Ignatzschineria cameli]|uniref:Aspartyl/glutamyl-tRNA(Asn/Gln) amidotransferase subunit C n=1 Tax=Ignatzschineria cameli TaxID=2182793 RepID=A0A2U2ASW7_9GAMM|nr:Asp-tRNA(Asn)/Glu-tRNA(Gln) amidotransferase subunit GatC [Ignatzschineria cameli]PWD85961.1 Asp-tRNA(Asn)/Glu-tRNA(Gln) amidotransferase GatCAB subunit C [Ignatzschineria cameli]PWD87829.1 Asp-tRNA(Asn)/Glu-tRNA(Gln) amidotransferase GatCAB subunit C [Ignatzschineria cameli]PWD90398.1 Asp-tRNA(Asn)/Glu-tRNA(Gln) amidotransferase GatCAB subunit C [Ignatzschineria cameli]PWD92281.1 Asp-tRNA(Asn)/Glu-tRNA(Gln) amidotransferase GatCAB subunit C [Ignatzschineria cameli]PWD93075.1 Asp-tRNA(Asn)/